MLMKELLQNLRTSSYSFLKPTIQVVYRLTVRKKVRYSKLPSFGTINDCKRVKKSNVFDSWNLLEHSKSQGINSSWCIRKFSANLPILSKFTEDIRSSPNFCIKLRSDCSVIHKLLGRYLERSLMTHFTWYLISWPNTNYLYTRNCIGQCLLKQGKKISQQYLTLLCFPW